MDSMIIDKIQRIPLSKIKTDGGEVLHALKKTESEFFGFGEAYFSCIAPNTIRAWKRHKRMTLNLIVPHGSVKFVFIEEEQKKIREENLGEDNYARLTIPPGIWFGFKGLSSSQSFILNIADIIHDSTEVENRNIADFPYDWDNN